MRADRSIVEFFVCNYFKSLGVRTERNTIVQPIFSLLITKLDFFVNLQRSFPFYKIDYFKFWDILSDNEKKCTVGELIDYIYNEVIIQEKDDENIS